MLKNKNKILKINDYLIINKYPTTVLKYHIIPNKRVEFINQLRTSKINHNFFSILLSFNNTYPNYKDLNEKAK